MLVLKLTESDTIATALDTIPSGAEVEVIYKGKKVAGFPALEEIPYGFKVCVKEMKAGSPVMKYAHVIGKASKDISVGELVHVHNIEGNRGRGDLENTK